MNSMYKIPPPLTMRMMARTRSIITNNKASVLTKASMRVSKQTMRKKALKYSRLQ